MKLSQRYLAPVLGALLVIALIAAGWFWYQADQAKRQHAINSFNDCAAAGYPVSESQPRQCRTPDGRLFTETLTTPDTDTADEDEASTEYTSPKGIVIYVDSPLANTVISSPVKVSGRVPGNWSFEANFPIDVLNANKQVIGQGFATLQGDWMTEEYVPFEASGEFDAPTTDTGYLVLRKSNASGLTENDDSIEVPIRFANSD
jgi:hypothetical protein